MRQLTQTYAEYLDFERTSAEKHEYLRGEVWAMAGGTLAHARITMNLGAALTAALKGRPCTVYSSDLRVRVEATNRSTYPDVTVVCGRPLVAADDGDAVINPTLIIEVLSDSTEASDRGEKFAHLQRLASLKEYVLVSQKERRIDVYRRAEGRSWVLLPCTEGELELRSVEVSVPLAVVYADPTPT